MNINMRIKFCSSDRFMTQQLLNGTQISSIFEQMCSKRMSERMWTNIFTNSRQSCQIFHNRENHGACQCCPPSVQEQNILVTFLNRQCISINFPQPDLRNRLWRKWYQALLTSLSFNQHVSFVDIQL